jgi:two-component system sensor histidine kinase PilS (NtrC family)
VRSSSSAAQRLSWISIFRTVAVALMLGAYGAHVLSRPSPIELRPDESLLFGLVGATFFLSAVYGVWLRRGGNEQLLAYVQLAGDALFAAGLCWVTGQLDSPFVSVFLMAVVAAAVALGRKGAITAAVVNSALIFAIVIAVQLSPDKASHPLTRWVFPVSINVLAQFLVAALAGYLATQLATTGGRLVARERDFTELAALHRQILAAMPSGLLTLSADGKVSYANRAATQILGAVEGSPEIQQRLPGVQKLAPHPRRHELRTEAGGERKVLGLSLVPLDGQPGASLVVFQDLTALRRAEEELERVDRLASLGKLSAQLAHEIRNPLAAMRGAAQMLGEGADATTAKLTGILVREADRLGALVEDFLRFARPSAPRLQPAAIDELVHQVVEIMRVDPLSDRVELKEELAPVRAAVDPDQLRQVLINLVRNALAAAAPNGEVRISVHDAAEHFGLEVWDSAGAIEERDLPHLFEPFFTRRPGGTGLGLSTVHSIVTAHEGRIQVSSSPAKGTRFSITLPKRT